MGWIVGRLYRDVSRLSEIVNVFFRYGFYDVIARTRFRSQVGWLSRLRKKDTSVPESRRFVQSLQSLGPTFIKLGQLLSTRPDLVPKDYFDALQELRDHVDALPFSQLRPIIEAEIGMSVFRYVEEKPLASASMAQVHRGKLKDGKDVVVKVLKPGIDETIAADLDLLSYAAHELDAHVPSLQQAKPKKIVELFREYTSHELDLRYEAQQARKFSTLIGKKVKIPLIYEEHTTRRVLVMEYVAHRPLTKAMLPALLDTFFDQIFTFGFFHADPHQGNVMLHGKRIALLDFGIVGKLTARQKEQLGVMLMGFAENDASKIVSALLKIGIVQEELVDADALPSCVEDLLLKYRTLPLGTIRAGEVFRELLEISSRFSVTPPHQFLLLSKCIVTIEGVVDSIDPSFQVFRYAKRYAKRLVRRTLLPRSLKAELLKDALMLREAVSVLPTKLIRTIDRLESGEFRIHFEHNIEHAFSTIDRVGNAISIGIIVAAYLVVSALFLALDIPPLYGSYSLIGIVGLGISLVFSFILIWKLEQKEHG